jgi:hypothetical protein
VNVSTWILIAEIRRTIMGDEVSKPKAGPKTDDQVASVNTILDIVNLFKKSGGGTTTETQIQGGGGDATAAVQALVQSILGGNKGVAAVAQGQKTAGLYGSTVNQMLQQKLIAEAAGQGAQLQLQNNPRTGTRSTTAPSKGAAVSPVQGLLAVAANNAVNSKAGKKVIDAAGDKIGTWADSLFSSGAADTATGSFGESGIPWAADTVGASPSWTDSVMSSGGQDFGFSSFGETLGSYATDVATTAVTDTVASSAADYAADDAWSAFSGMSGYAKGGRVPMKGNVGYARIGVDKSGVAPAVEYVLGPESSGGDAKRSGAYAPFSLSDAQMLGKFASTVTNTLGKGLISAAVPAAAPYIGPAMSLLGVGKATTDFVTNASMNAHLDNLRSAVELDDGSRQRAIDDLAVLGLDATGSYPGGNAPASYTNAGQNLVGPASKGNAIDLESMISIDNSGANDNEMSVSPGNALGDAVSVTQNPDGSYTMSGGGGPGGQSAEANAESQAASDSFSDMGWAAGGRVKGDKKLGVDDVNAKLDGGEVVIKAKSVQMIDRLFGPEFLNELNNMHKGGV